MAKPATDEVVFESASSKVLRVEGGYQVVRRDGRTIEVPTVDNHNDEVAKLRAVEIASMGAGQAPDSATLQPEAVTMAAPQPPATSGDSREPSEQRLGD